MTADSKGRELFIVDNGPCVRTERCTVIRLPDRVGRARSLRHGHWRPGDFADGFSFYSMRWRARVRCAGRSLGGHPKGTLSAMRPGPRRCKSYCKRRTFRRYIMRTISPCFHILRFPFAILWRYANAAAFLGRRPAGPVRPLSRCSRRRRYRLLLPSRPRPRLASCSSTYQLPRPIRLHASRGGGQFFTERLTRSCVSVRRSLVHIEACGPARGQEKGGVEGLVGFARRNFLVPVPARPTTSAGSAAGPTPARSGKRGPLRVACWSDPAVVRMHR